jgi:hypothetical protein
LAIFGFKGMEHPPHSPDLAPYVFILFGSMKQVFAGQGFDIINDIFMGVEVFLRTSYRSFFRNGYGDCVYAVTAAENTLNEHYKMGYFLL